MRRLRRPVRRIGKMVMCKRRGWLEVMRVGDECEDGGFGAVSTGGSVGERCSGIVVRLIPQHLAVWYSSKALHVGPVRLSPKALRPPRMSWTAFHLCLGPPKLSTMHPTYVSALHAPRMSWSFPPHAVTLNVV